ncbi:serine hydrolase domain-containing protein [Nocardioides astragali]|uniref:Serine hydrolase domain-containing protein n=1 Tax=Nocardioides astragali TaxID=1776736 RepID=A0ABW2N8B6_9ACTN|nr:serine hydrolase domain-containing protein [Nocardioides astragali]
MTTINPDAAATSAPHDPADESVRRVVQQFVDESRIPGMSLAIARPEGHLSAVAAGYADLAARRPATVTDQYPWFSMTKIATATAAMQLHVSGHFDVDAPIGTYLRSYRPHPVHGHPSTRQLLTHTAGLPNPLPVRWVRPEDQTEDREQHRRIVAKYGTPRHTVGAQPHYSNVGYLLVGDVIEAVTGQSVQDRVTATVLRPLGMSATGYRYVQERPRATGHVRLPAVFRPILRRFLPGDLVGPQVEGWTQLHPFLINGAAYGGLIGTVTDAATLAAAHAAASTDVTELLPHADIDRMRTITAPGKRFDHGTGWFRKPADSASSPTFVEHYGTGGGYWNAMRIYPQRRLAIVAMTNTTAAWDVDKLFTQIGQLTWH